MKRSKNIRIIFSGGGTGGHIFPAIAIAREIAVLDPSAEILFVGAKGKMEMDKVPKAGFRIIGLPVSGFHRRITLKNLAFPFKLIISLMKARGIIRSFKPDLVIGTGGFASGPILRAAVKRGIPAILQEQNSWPGVTNRILSKKVSLICVAYPDMDKFFPADKILLAGNPVRTDLVLPPESKPEARQFFGLKPDMAVILIFGGSQGARTLNVSLAGKLTQLAKEPVQLIWQTGSAFKPQAESLVREAGARNVRVFEFIHEMDKAYAASDLVVSRSGALTLSELSLVGKPAILVPLPSAAEDHQTKNAIAYAKEDAAIIVPDAEAPARLVDVMLGLVVEKERLTRMGQKMKLFGKPDATRQIAGEALKLCC